MTDYDLLLLYSSHYSVSFILSYEDEFNCDYEFCRDTTCHECIFERDCMSRPTNLVPKITDYDTNIFKLNFPERCI